MRNTPLAVGKSRVHACEATYVRFFEAHIVISAASAFLVLTLFPVSTTFFLQRSEHERSGSNPSEDLDHPSRFLMRVNGRVVEFAET
ncbi:uncharacterized protein SCHCODRAFT_02541240 [Schizophyllum commune H4-8]|uniref:uncharacterized protein n=1 Tax=Schizophyllum commune (strain H4-8 / FGSC 9210) TaxID=578458 RepID=UPI002160E90D|nr:uncharacterized protein SCHCODRAFT_02541240 [Schizophyllum commune H4-8]KAI5891987.1 hypothetical protein SCHCODRAFT_02541240 [Schizophyllum commune H4-8]